VTVQDRIPEHEAPIHVIEPRGGWVGLDFRELWRFRELLLVFTWRNILVRYKQTVLGVLWALLQPVFLMVVFTLVFGRLAKLPSEGVPYPIFSFAALLPWLFFANALTQSSASVVGAGNLISKVYFPRLTIPIAAVLSALVDFVIAFAVLIGLMIYYSVVPDWTIVLLPAFTLLAFVTALGVGLWLSALNVRYRDVMYTIPFLTQLWFFATPVVYSARSVREPLQTLLGLNPMAGVVVGFRWALIGTAHPAWGTLALSIAVAIVILVTGAAYFRRLERTFADVV
jgi:ABC-type polysaccharide/polyol phosphate export systems, permease component